MDTDSHARLRDQLVHDEGLRLKPYKDTVGKLTIGVGRNLDDVGLSRLEAMYLLENDIARAVRDAVAAFPWFVELDPVRQSVIVMMVFNMGVGGPKHGLRTFTNTLRAIQEGRYSDAAVGMRRSRWAKQVGLRAQRLALQMETGQWASVESA